MAIGADFRRSFDDVVSDHLDVLRGGRVDEERMLAFFIRICPGFWPFC